VKVKSLFVCYEISCKGIANGARSLKYGVWAKAAVKITKQSRIVSVQDAHSGYDTQQVWRVSFKVKRN
jgi:hypothetical protein